MLTKPYRGRSSGPEDTIAMEVASFLRAATIEGALSATWTSIPHELGAVSVGSAQFRSMQSRYAKQIAMGLVTGSADYVFIDQNGGGWIELKSRTGSMQPSQRDFRTWCEIKCVRHAVCRSLDDVIDTLSAWGMLDG